MCPPVSDAGSSADDGGRGNDLTPPRLLDLAFTPSTIDTSAVDQVVTIDLRASDDLSGVAYIQPTFRSPSGGQSQSLIATDAQQVSGTPTDGGWRGTFVFPRYAEQGNWTLESVTLADRVRNLATLRAAEFVDAGWPTQLQQNGAGDSTAPTLQLISVTPASIDTSGAARQVTVTMHVTDTQSGTRMVGGALLSPRNQLLGASYSQVTGTPVDGEWSATIEVPRYSPQGTYTVTPIALYDQLLNLRQYQPNELRDAGFTIDVLQTGAGDVTPPTLSGLDFAPRSFSTQVSDVTVCITVRVTDDLSGAVVGSVFFSPPPGVATLAVAGAYSLRVSGTATDSVFVGTVTFPRYAPAGTWTLSTLTLRDEANNVGYLDGAAVSALGFSSTLVITP